MPSFRTEPPPAETSRVGVLICNLGTPEAPTAQALRPYLAEFLGDRRVIELPRLLWTLSAAGWPLERLHLIGADWDKRDPEGLAEAWRIERVPTWVVVRGEAELGRIVERAEGPVEAQLARIMVGG